MHRPFVLINSNTLKPRVSPVGLEYVGEALVNAGIPVETVDLAWEFDWRAALNAALSSTEPLAVGISFRNIDDCSSVTRQVFAPWLKELVAEVKRHTSAPVVLGGVGFSVAPAKVVEHSGADYGIAGDGEETAVFLARCLQKSETPKLPNLVYRRHGQVLCSQRKDADISKLPAFRRDLFDNARYQAKGGMVGIETRRGCPQSCIYCADPVAKGKRLRLRSPDAVVSEMESLARQGVTWYHMCDSEFNMPVEHAKEVCSAIIKRGLGGRIQWYTYCSPAPFDGELGALMKRSGCAGINFGVDTVHDGQLRRVGRTHRLADVGRLIDIMRAEGLNFMFDMMLGGPGETEETVRATAYHINRLDVPLTGVSLGVRVYPGTPMARLLMRQPGWTPEAIHNIEKPAFYFSPGLGDDPAGIVGECFRDNPRVVSLAAPGDKGSYNYAGSEWLSAAIENGARGAYWDIIRRGGR